MYRLISTVNWDSEYKNVSFCIIIINVKERIISNGDNFLIFEALINKAKYGVTIDVMEN